MKNIWNHLDLVIYLHDKLLQYIWQYRTSKTVDRHRRRYRPHPPPPPHNQIPTDCSAKNNAILDSCGFNPWIYFNHPFGPPNLPFSESRKATSSSSANFGCTWAQQDVAIPISNHKLRIVTYFGIVYTVNTYFAIFFKSIQISLYNMNIMVSTLI